MIFIVVKFPVRRDRVDDWLTEVADFTAATRDEPGNLFFEWSRSVDEPDTFVLVEGFRDGDAGSAHVNSEHFKAGISTMSGLVAAVPQIISQEIPVEGWADMGEVKPTEA